MAKYRKKPVVIEAVQFVAGEQDHAFAADVVAGIVRYPEDGTMLIRTLEGVMVAQPGDWIIRGVNGELYPCKPDIFAKTYEDAGPDVPQEFGFKKLVSRFLSWKLPKNFSPDAGIAFEPYESQSFDGPFWPIGTNLLDAEQAREMLEHVLQPETTGLTFGQAIEALKAGKRVTRQGWNGRGMWLAYSPGAVELDSNKFWAGPNRDYAERRGGSATVLPCITMKTAGGEILMGWLASQTDMLAEDWEIVE